LASRSSSERPFRKAVSPFQDYFTVSPTIVLRMKDVALAVRVKCELPVAAPAVFVKVIVEDPLPGEPRVCGLKVAFTPAANPVMERATDELKPPRAIALTFIVLLAVELTVTLLTLGVSEKPGTFTVTTCFCVTLPPVAVNVTG
jgi:hypothetical protein